MFLCRIYLGVLLWVGIPPQLWYENRLTWQEGIPQMKISFQIPVQEPGGTVRDLLKCTRAPRPVTPQSINWLLKQKWIPGNGPAQSCLRQTGLAWGGGRFQKVSDPGEDTSYKVSAHPRAMTEPLRICRAQPDLLSNLGVLHTHTWSDPCHTCSCVPPPCKKGGWWWLGPYLSPSNTQRNYQAMLDWKYFSAVCSENFLEGYSLLLVPGNARNYPPQSHHRNNHKPPPAWRDLTVTNLLILGGSSLLSPPQLSPPSEHLPSPFHGYSMICSVVLISFSSPLMISRDRVQISRGMGF